MKNIIKNKYELQRGRKYTRLLLNGNVFQQWLNEEIDFTLKTSDFEKQVEYFRNNLKG